MKKIFTHYGVDVLYQAINKRFKDTLKKNGVKYIDLPIQGYDVITYADANGKRQFACIIKCNCIEEYMEKVMITNQIPLDASWENFVKDILGQVSGEQPLKMETKSHMLCRQANNMCLQNMVVTNDFFEMCEREIDPWEFSLAIANLGYSVEELLEMDHSDVDEDFLKRLIGKQTSML